MTIGSLFSGIGGFDIGFEQAGLGPVLWQVEIDPVCRRVLERHWPDVERHEDVTECHSAEYLDSAVKTWYIPSDGITYTQEEQEMAGKLKKLTKEQAVTCVEMYESGLSLTPIAGYFNVSRQAMWDLLRRRTTMRPQKTTGKDNHFYRGGGTEDGAAQTVVEKAMDNGILIRPLKCDACGKIPKQMKDGRTSIQTHHPDYNKPLDVMWLCQKCHHEWHKNNTPKRKEVQVELAQVDIICGGFP